MKALCRILAVLVLLVFIPGQSQAQPYEVIFVNQTGGAVLEFYASSVDTEYWEDDLLDGRTLEPGDEFLVTFVDPDPVYDLRLVFPREEWREYNSINIRDNRRIILHP